MKYDGTLLRKSKAKNAFNTQYIKCIVDQKYIDELFNKDVEIAKAKAMHLISHL